MDTEARAEMPSMDTEARAQRFMQDLMSGAYDKTALDWRGPTIQLVKPEDLPLEDRFFGQVKEILGAERYAELFEGPETEANLYWLGEQSVYSGSYLSGICVAVVLDDWPEIDDPASINWMPDAWFAVSDASVLDEPPEEAVEALEIVIVLTPEHSHSMYDAERFLAKALEYADYRKIRMLIARDNLEDSEVRQALRQADFVDQRDESGRLTALYCYHLTPKEMMVRDSEMFAARLKSPGFKQLSD